MVDYIDIYDSYPDDSGIYCYEPRYEFQRYEFQSEEPTFLRSDFETNTIRILELKNVLRQYRHLAYGNGILALLYAIKKEDIKDGEALLLQEIEELKSSSKIIRCRISEIETAREKSGKKFKRVYIFDGKSEARTRYLQALTGRNKQNEVEEKRMSLK